jgi:hypothetical protein
MENAISYQPYTERSHDGLDFLLSSQLGLTQESLFEFSREARLAF